MEEFATLSVRTDYLRKHDSYLRQYIAPTSLLLLSHVFDNLTTLKETGLRLPSWLNFIQMQRADLYYTSNGRDVSHSLNVYSMSDNTILLETITQVLFPR